MNVTASAQPSGEVGAGTTIQLTATAEAVHVAPDCSRHVQRVNTGTFENSATFGAVLNLGSGEEISINQLADCAITAFERSRDDPAACWDGRHKFRLMSVFNELLIGRSARIARNYIQI